MASIKGCLRNIRSTEYCVSRGKYSQRIKAVTYENAALVLICGGIGGSAVKAMNAISKMPCVAFSSFLLPKRYLRGYMQEPG